MDKKARKLIEKEAREYADGLSVELFANLNPLCIVLEEIGKLPETEEEKNDFCLKQLTKDNRWREELMNNWRNMRYYIKQHTATITELIYQDALYTAGCIDRFGSLLDAINDFAKYCICTLSNENRYKQVKLLDNEGLISKICLTALKLKTYSICDDLKDEWGKQITEYCTNNENEVIVELLEEEYKDKAKEFGNNIADVLTLQDYKKLRDCIKSGEKFIIYRGFAITEEDRVRRGTKSEGDIYYLQSAGTGMSYSLNEDIAYFFAHRAITDTLFDEDFRDNRYYQPDSTWYVPNDRYIETKADEVTVIRDKKRLKPIVCKYECDPAKITGYKFGTESEIIIRPEDLKLLHYEIPHSHTLAERHWKWMNIPAIAPASLMYGAIANGLTALTTVDEEEYGLIYAETERIRDFLEELIDCGVELDNRLTKKIVSVFLENSVVIPEDINPMCFGNGLREYMENPTNVKRRPNTHYKTKRKALFKKLKTTVNKGFG